MTKVTKKEIKTGGSDLSKQTFVLQKGISRSGRAIKPKTLFGEPLIEIVTKTKQNQEKMNSLKTVAKVVKPKAVKSSEKAVVKKTPVKKEKPVLKSPKSPHNIPKFTPVDITAIIKSKSTSPVKPKTNTVSSPVNNVVKSPKLSSYEARQKEIGALRAKLAKLEALQEAERKSRPVNNSAVSKKVVKKEVKATTSDDRPARVKKPTWKAVEAE